MLRLLSFSLLFMLSFFALAEEKPQFSPWYKQSPSGEVQLEVEVFLSSTCPHCQQADLFFNKIEKKYPWLMIKRYVVNQDKSALEYFYQRLRQQNQQDFSIPSVFFCNTRWVGFDEDAKQGKALLSGMTYCQKNIRAQGELKQGIIDALRKKSKLAERLIS